MVLTPWPSQFGRYLDAARADHGARARASCCANATRSREPPRADRDQAPRSASCSRRSSSCSASSSPTATSRSTRPSRGAPQRLFFYRPRWQQHDAALAWLARTAQPDAVVATSTPHRLYLASGLRAVLPPFEPDPDAGRAPARRGAGRVSGDRRARLPRRHPPLRRAGRRRVPTGVAARARHARRRDACVPPRAALSRTAIRERPRDRAIHGGASRSLGATSAHAQRAVEGGPVIARLPSFASSHRTSAPTTRDRDPDS